MWKELYYGYDKSKEPKLTTFPNNKDGVHYDQMVFDLGYFYSQCEHHLLTFFGTYYFAYFPGEKILGLSKIAKLVDYHAARLQIQERLAKEVADNIEKAVSPRGIALVLKARHLCKEMRGVRKHKSIMITSELRGFFRNRESTRMEFLEFIKQTER